MRLLLDARGLSKRFIIRHNRAGSLKERVLGLAHRGIRERREEFWALRDVTLSIHAGESVGLIGRNGSGKSTFLKVLGGIYEPTSGSLRRRRGLKIGTMIELGLGFHPELTARENLRLSAAIQGVRQRELAALYDSIVAFSGLEHFMDVPLKNFSSGMHMRLGFSISAHLSPDVLLLDEIFAVGDEDFQKRCIRTMRRFRDEGRTIVFVSHASSAIRTLCDRVCLLDQGRLVFDGEVDEGLTEYQRLLLASSRSSSEAVLAPAAAAPVADVTVGTGSPVRGGAAGVSDHELDVAWHRLAVGGMWAEIGGLQFQFLRHQGLEPRHYLLDVGCGSLRGGVHFIPYLEPGHYVGLDKNAQLVEAGRGVELPRRGVAADRGQFVVNDTFDLGALPVAFDFALAQSLFTELPLNSIARCLDSVIPRLQPDGRFFATYFEAPSPGSFEPIVHPGGVTSYADREPYHYDFATLARLSETFGGRAERVGPWNHPRGQMMMVITRSR